MPDIVTSADVKTLMQAANFAAFRTSLGLTALATTTPGTGVVTALAVNIGSAGAFLTFNGNAGTPSALVGTNITGTAASLTAGAASAVAVGGITGLGTGVGTFLATPSGANLASALTTALPASKGGTGLTALGTGIATALGINVGSAGAPVLFNGAAGTPSSIVLTNGTALPVTVKVTGSNYTIGTTSAQELWGGVIYVTGACTLTIPAVAAGQSFTVVTIGAVAVSVDPNASDLIYLDGTALSDGDKITNLSTAGDIAVFTYYDATGWSASTNGWTDGN